ncbi:MAG: hypothetical protein WBM32_14590 [Crocosphaera sp.]
MENAQIGDFRDEKEDKKIEFRDGHRLWWVVNKNRCGLTVAVVWCAMAMEPEVLEVPLESRQTIFKLIYVGFWAIMAIAPFTKNSENWILHTTPNWYEKNFLILP